MTKTNLENPIIESDLSDYIDISSLTYLGFCGERPVLYSEINKSFYTYILPKNSYKVIEMVF